MKNHISTPIHFAMQAQTIADSAHIMTSNMEIIAEVQGKTSEETRDLAETICFSVNHHLEFMEALRECFTDPGALAYEDFASAKRRIKAINDTILEALSKS